VNDTGENGAADITC